MARITTDAQLNELVAKIKEKVSPDQAEAFLNNRLTAHDPIKRIDTYLTLKEGRYYLPYPYNKKLVAMLHKDSEAIEDEFGI